MREKKAPRCQDNLRLTNRIDSGDLGCITMFCSDSIKPTKSVFQDGQKLPNAYVKRLLVERARERVGGRPTAHRSWRWQHGPPPTLLTARRPHAMFARAGPGDQLGALRESSSSACLSLRRVSAAAEIRAYEPASRRPATGSDPTPPGCPSPRSPACVVASDPMHSAASAQKEAHGRSGPSGLRP